MRQVQQRHRTGKKSSHQKPATSAVAPDNTTPAPVSSTLASGMAPSITGTPCATAGAWEAVVVEAEAAAVEAEAAAVATRREADGGRSLDGDASARPARSGKSMLRSIPDVAEIVLRCYSFTAGVKQPAPINVLLSASASRVTNSRSSLNSARPARAESDTLAPELIS
jgi:hypothetical protein